MFVDRTGACDSEDCMADIINGTGKIPPIPNLDQPFSVDDYRKEVKINDDNIEINCKGRVIKFNDCLNDYN